MAKTTSANGMGLTSLGGLGKHMSVMYVLVLFVLVTVLVCVYGGLNEHLAHRHLPDTTVHGDLEVDGVTNTRKQVTAKTFTSNRFNISSTESGSVVTVPETGAASEIGLPKITSDLKGWFVTLVAAANNGAHTITLQQGANSDGTGTLANTPFFGILLDDGANSLTGTTSAVVAASKFKKGDSIDLVCDGTNYIITVRAVTADAVTVS